jgi:hypothetical protein
MMMPATILSCGILVRTNWPTAVAVAPTTTKVIEKPITNMTELRITARFSEALAALPFSWSREKPEMIEMYPGTSGRTQGERKKEYRQQRP